VVRVIQIPGVRPVLRRQVSWSWVRSFRTVSVPVPVPFYCSEERENALKLCGWKGGKQLLALWLQEKLLWQSLTWT
jgi:hypothetical protein